MAKYLGSGLQAGEKVMYFFDTMTIEEVNHSLEKLGVDLRGRDKDFVLSEALPTYRPYGSFSTADMLAVVGQFYQQSREEGYVGSRGTGEMSWALVKGRAREEDLMEYEARLTEVVGQYLYEHMILSPQ